MQRRPFVKNRVLHAAAFIRERVAFARSWGSRCFKNETDVVHQDFGLTPTHATSTGLSAIQFVEMNSVQINPSG